MGKRARNTSGEALPSSKHGRGGYLQRMAHENEMEGKTDIAPTPSKPSDESNCSCPLTDVLLGFVFWGLMSATRAQYIAQAAVQSGLNTYQIKRLARSGAGGKYSGSVWRDIKRSLGVNWLLGAVWKFKITCADGPDRVKERIFPVLLPHMLFSILYHRFRTLFVYLFMGGCVDKLRFFGTQWCNIRITNIILCITTRWPLGIQITTSGMASHFVCMRMRLVQSVSVNNGGKWQMHFLGRVAWAWLTKFLHHSNIY